MLFPLVQWPSKYPKSPISLLHLTAFKEQKTEGNLSPAPTVLSGTGFPRPKKRGEGREAGRGEEGRERRGGEAEEEEWSWCWLPCADSAVAGRVWSYVISKPLEDILSEQRRHRWKAAYDTQTPVGTGPFPQLHRLTVYHGIYGIISCSTYGREKAQHGRVEPLAQYEVQRTLCSQTHCCWERPNSIDASGGARRSSLASHEQTRAGILKQPKKEGPMWICTWDWELWNLSKNSYS